MLRHNLDKGLEADVAETAPLLAAVIIDMQSVFIRGAVWFIANTWSMAQSSAAAAVEMRVERVLYRQAMGATPFGNLQLTGG